MSSSHFYAERPTLPPLHTLDLPVPFTRRSSSPDSNYDIDDQPLSMKHTSHSRRVSTFSSTSSRTPSPSPSYDSPSRTQIKVPTLPSLPSLSSASPTTPSRRIRPIVHLPKFKLVPCSLDVAEAVVLVPPPNAPSVPTLNLNDSASATKKPGQALLLVGPALNHIRHPQRQIAKGARIHPYRFLRAEGGKLVRSKATSLASSP